MKTCPQCGTEQKEDAKFCTNCGHAFENTKSASSAEDQKNASTNTQSTPETKSTPTAKSTSTSTTNSDFERVKANGLNYWHWLVKTAGHPSRATEASGHYFGLISLLLLSLFTSITLARLIVSANSTIASFGDSLLGGNTTYLQSTSEGMGQNTFRLLITFVIINFVIFLGAFIAHKRISHEHRPMMTVLNQYGQRLSLPVFTSFFAAILALAGLSGLTTLFMLIIGFNLSLQFIGFYQIALQEPHKSDFDPAYVLLITTICMGLVIVIVSMIFGLSTLSSIL